MEINWKNWCRLCAANNEDLIDVFIKHEIYCNFAEIIEKLLKISINSYDEAPTKICSPCHQFVNSLLKFSVQCSKVQEMYSELQFNYTFELIPEDTTSNIREKYGLKNVADCGEYDCLSTSEDNTKKTRRKIMRKTNTRNRQVLCEQQTNPEDPLMISNQQSKIIEMKDDIHSQLSHIENVENENLENTALEKSVVELKIENQYDNNNFSNQIEERIQCEKCPKKFTLMARYLLHLKNKHCIEREPPKKVKQNIIINCRICNKGFSNRGSYHLHLKLKHFIIEGPIIHTCPECNKSFKTSGALTSHKRTHQKLEERIFFPCNICDKKFSSEYTCETHIRTRHKGEKPFVCDQCGKTLTSKRSLYFHQFIHVESEPLQCEMCSKMFVNKLRLSVHIKTHSQPRVNCPICNLTLKNKSFLNHHMITHSDVKQFKCTYCGNEFKRKKNLRTHMIIHTGLKPYECAFCSISFANRSNCKKHQRHAHPEEFAALEATGKEHYSKNIPKLSQLQAMLDQMAANRETDSK